MALDKLGGETFSQGDNSKDRVIDETSSQLLRAIQIELKVIRHILLHMSDLNLEHRDIEDLE